MRTPSPTPSAYGYYKFSFFLSFFCFTNHLPSSSLAPRFSHRFECSARARVLPIHPRDPWVSGSLGLGRSSGLIPGEFGFIQPFWGTLMNSDLFVGLRDFVTTFCVHVHAFDAFVGHLSLSGLFMRGSGPLAGKSGVAEAFIGLFKLLTSLCMRACMSNVSVWFLGLSGFPMCGSAPLAGKSGLTDVFTGLF